MSAHLLFLSEIPTLPFRILLYPTDTISKQISYSSPDDIPQRDSQYSTLVLITVTVLSPFLGLIFAGLDGVMIGLAVWLLSYLLGPLVLIKVPEIQRSSSKGQRP
jgi:hypothetical protein